MKLDKYQKRRSTAIVVATLAILLGVLGLGASDKAYFTRLWREFFQYDLNLASSLEPDKDSLALLEKLEVKGRAPKTGYKRELFASSWQNIDGCSVRNLVLKRDLTDLKIDKNCKVLSGKLDDPYSGKLINFIYGPSTSRDVQIDHIVAVSDAWQKGAQNWTSQKRYNFYNDLDNLIAVSGTANQNKSDGDAATWLPANKSFRCRYIALQIKVKLKYGLWLTEAEKTAMYEQLQKCPKTTTN